MKDDRQPPRILIIAGSDNSGGAGIQADIKTVTMLGGYAMSAITALTAQNTTGVFGVQPVPTDFVIQQIDTAASDIGVDAVKIGMIGSAPTAMAVADCLERLTAARDTPLPIVFDPVMVATSGGILADDATAAAFGRLMALASVTTPNLDELAALGGVETMLGKTRALLVKGGHAQGDVLTDRLLFADRTAQQWSDVRIDTRSTHGTGCTLASAMATGLGAGLSLIDATALARRFVRAALEAAPGFGAGHGPLGHQATHGFAR